MFDFEKLDYYQLLGVARSASADDVKRAYRREIAKYHPDRFVNADQEQQRYARVRSQSINEAYASLSGQGAARRVARPPTIVPEPVQPRDHQSELYEQAREHLAAGRTLQAIAVLRQLQQINPFYRDSGALLEQAEAQVQGSRSSRRGRPLLIGGTVLGAAALLFAVWSFALRPAPVVQTGQVENTAAPLAIVASAVPVTAAISTALPTSAPTAAPTEQPTAAPTEQPTSAPTEEPTAAPTAAPTELPALETGALLFSDQFSNGGWADLAGNGWAVGFRDQRYRVAASANAGPIWSYRGGAPLNLSLGLDTQVVQGAGGVMLRFVDDFNYLSFTISPAQGSFLLDRVSGGVTTVLASGQNAAIVGGTNRIVVQIRNNHYRLFANNQQLAEGDLPPGPASNRYGLIALGGNVASEVFFDNLEIRAAQ